MREELRAAHLEGSCVLPYVGVYSKQIASMEETVPTLLEGGGGGASAAQLPLVNVEKLRAAWKVSHYTHTLAPTSIRAHTQTHTRSHSHSHANGGNCCDAA